tara:strand:- start:3003 stop:3731 length:729 start_codon:yes stop_codon:yes gene_type:complete
MENFFFNYYFFKEVVNTNDKIRTINLNENPKKFNLALYSVEQSKGRGRGSNVWKSSKGDFTSSFLLNRRFNTKELGQINLSIVFIILKTFKSLYKNVDFKFKWPNDIFVNKMKIAGILIETNIIKNNILYIIIGIGINFISAPKLNKSKTISISKFSSSIDPLGFFFKISDEIVKVFSEFNKIDFKEMSLNVSNSIFSSNGIVKIKQNKNIFSGHFVKIDELGSIIIKDFDGEKKLTYGEML